MFSARRAPHAVIGVSPHTFYTNIYFCRNLRHRPRPGRAAIQPPSWSCVATANFRITLCMPCACATSCSVRIWKRGSADGSTSMEAPKEVWKCRWKYIWKYGSMELWKCLWKCRGSMEMPMEVWKCVRKERMGWPFSATVPGRAVLSVSIIRTFELSHFASIL